MNTLAISVRRLSFKKRPFLNPVAIIDQKYEKSSKSDSSSSSSSSSSDTEKQVVEPKSKNDAKLDKLNKLLKTLVEQDQIVKTSKLDLAKPPSKRLKKEPGTESVKTERIEKRIVKAVTEVANEIGGDVKKTESELLMKLLNVETSPTGSRNITDIVKGMQVDRESDSVTSRSRADQVRTILDQKQNIRPQRQRSVSKIQDLTQRINLFGSKPLGIFTDPNKLNATPTNTMWHKLNERELKLSITHPPANYFQQMILWTEQGKLWRFPIDNEQGLDEEKKVYFAKHVFLEEHLEPWCPPKGPIRHFMELVCVGLSKNSYLTVDAKVEHIHWYKNYFEDKRKLLLETGAIPMEMESKERKSIE